jgi:hypothetical protein
VDDEMPVTEQMLKAGILAWDDAEAISGNWDDHMSAIYRAMAALAPPPTGIVDLTEEARILVRAANARIIALEAENAEWKTAFAKERDFWRVQMGTDKNTQIAALEAENRLWVKKWDETEQKWGLVIVERDGLIQQLAAMRVATTPTAAQQTAGDIKPTAVPKAMPATALASSKSDPRRVGG